MASETQASEVAAELRRIADALDKEPAALIYRPILAFYCREKEHFINLARLLPKPLKKVWREHTVELHADSSNLILSADIPRNLVCELIEPAKPAVYRCEPLLSPEEEEALA